MTDTHIKINAVTPKVQYTGNGVTTVFPYEFAIFDESDMVVYLGDEVQESGYSVSGAGQTEGGNVTFDVAPEDGVKITLLRSIPIERITDFQEGGTFRPKNLNDEFDRQTAFLQQVQETLTRAVKVGPTSEVEPEEVLTQVERVYDSIDNVDAVADNISNVNAVAGNSTNINAVAGNATNINAVAGNATNINAVNANKTNIDAVAGNSSNINAVASNAENINAVNSNKSNIDAVAGNATNINAVNANKTNIDNCATNIAAIIDAPNQASAASGSANDASGYATAAANSASAAALSAASCMPILFDHKWSDHEIDNMAWLRADTYSWQDGTVYSNAYQHLVDDIDGKTATSETIGSYTISYYLADDGHKITTDETTVANIYNESGVAWYYVLDTANTRFKLPRENPAREELIQVVRGKGNGNTLGLTNGTNNVGITASTSNGCFAVSSGYGIPVTTSALSNNVQGTFGLTTDSTKSGIISDMTDSTSVYKGKQYLYFYVGQFSQSATEQTAGLNAELFNGKADIEALNNKIQPVSTLPVTPTSGVLYVIPE